MAQKDIQVCFNVHFDSVSLWLGSFGGEDSPCDISRGVHAAKVGTPRLLDVFDKYGITTTWNITGHSMESFPKESKLVAQAGHELGLHGYAHENPLAMSKEQESAVLNKTFDLVVELCGKAPKGYSAPWWELSRNTIDLLLAKGIEYDHSLMETSPWYALLNAQVTYRWKKMELYIGGENLTGYRQHDVIVSPNDPWSPYFNATQVWAPLMGAIGYIGIRVSPSGI
jgi:peptidoglycan/xylan/chitin deacetylase (PgdA/CDA1 family)